MIISDLNHMDTAESNVQGSTYSFYENDRVDLTFNTYNNFATTVNNPKAGGNAAAAGAKGVANNYYGSPTYSFTKADTLAVADYLGGSFSASTSVAVINAVPRGY